MVKIRHFKDLAELWKKLDAWRDLGVAGVVVSDHLFDTSMSSAEQERHDPHVLLACIGARYDDLMLASMFSNISIDSPVPILRRNAELAYYGGDRILAGLGAGWDRGEFKAAGRQMPSHTDRVALLGEALAIATQLRDTGISTFHGAHLRTEGLPASPRPAAYPRLAVGGGSSSVISLAVRYADHLDFNTPSWVRLGPPAAARVNDRAADTARRLKCRLEDLMILRHHLDESCQAHGRDPGSITRSITISSLHVSASESQASCIRTSPYIACGTPSRISEFLRQTSEQLGLDYIVLPDSDGLCAALSAV